MPTDPSTACERSRIATNEESNVPRMQNLAKMDLTACMMMGVTGPILRSTGYEWDLRRAQPYCGYETYDFDVVTWDTQDAYGRFRIRLEETWQSLRIVEQCLERLERTQGQPVMVGDAKRKHKSVSCSEGKYIAIL